MIKGIGQHFFLNCTSMYTWYNRLKCYISIAAKILPSIFERHPNQMIGYAQTGIACRFTVRQIKKIQVNYSFND